MKKAILVAILISIVITAVAYYYFFVMTGVEDSQALPSKVKITIKIPETVQVDKSEKKEKEGEKKGDIQKVEQKKEEKRATTEQKAQMKSEETKKPEGKKEEAKPVVEKAKEVQKASERKRKIVGYRLEYKVGSEEEADKIRLMLINDGYHTAKKVVVNKKYFVVIAPFTDKWEAQYVRDSILKELQLNFVVNEVYK